MDKALLGFKKLWPLMQHFLIRFRKSKTVNMLAKLSFSLGILWYVMRNVQMSALVGVVSKQALYGPLGVVFFTLCHIVLNAARWQKIVMVLAGRDKPDFPLRSAINFYYISIFFNNCLPGTVGGDVARVWMSKTRHIPITLAINAVIIDRAIALIGLCVLVLLTLPFLNNVAGNNAVYILPPLVLLVIAGFWLLPFIQRLLTPYEHVRLIHWVLHFIGCLRLLLVYPGQSAQSLLYAMISHMFAFSSIYVLANSMDIQIGFWQCMTLMPVVMLLMALPISVGGWGVREAGMVGMLGLIGISSAAALAISVEAGLLAILVSLPGLGLWLLLRVPKEQRG